MNKYKICCLTSVHPAFDVRIFHKQARSLAKAGYDVRLIAPHSKDEWVDGVKIIAVPKSKNRAERMFLTSCRILSKALRERAHVYHFHDPELILVGLLLKCLGAKIVYDVHEDYPASIKTKHWLPSVVRGIVACMFDIFERTCAHLFDAIIPATDNISKRFHNGKLVILHNYPILCHDIGEARLSSPAECHTVVYAGILTRLRGAIEMVRSLSYIDAQLPVRLKLLGRFIEPDLEEELRSIEGFSKVDFVGLVPYEDVKYYLSSADVGLVLFHPAPNHTAAMPNKLFEYISLDLPVIASNFPLWKRIIEENGCGLTVDPMNPQEIAAAIEYLLKRPGLMAEMSRNGRKAALEKYNWKRETEKLLNLYAELSGNEAGTASSINNHSNMQ